MATIPVRKPKPNGHYAALVAEALEVERELRGLNTAEAAKLTPAAYLREATAIAHTTAEKLAALHAELERRTLVNAQAALRRMVAAVRSVNYGRPPRELRRLNHLLTGDALAELAMLNHSSFELFALAVQIAGAGHPEDFGACTDSAAYDLRLVELQLKRDDLLARLAAEFTADDLLIGETDKAGRAQVSLKIAAGAVPLGPNVGARLVNHLLSKEQV